ncbi:MAG: hypothetical protein R3255_08045 [Candidatus Lokiarchaeia archaeon]|nr:hypothetical protein [Candidatus Lokiarchaeia archaeon]
MAIMFNLFQDKIKRNVCGICKEKIDRNKCYVLLEVKIVPPILLVFHLTHFYDLITILENYIKKREDGVFEKFIHLGLGEVKEERRWAEELGIEGEFKKDINEVMTFKLYDELIKALEREFVCDILGEKKTFEDCLRCMSRDAFVQCDITLFFSKKPHLERYRKVLWEV